MNNQGNKVAQKENEKFSDAQENSGRQFGELKNETN